MDISDAWIKNSCKLFNQAKQVQMTMILVVFYIPSTARSFRDSTPIFTPFQPGFEPWAVAWQLNDKDIWL